jgi:hypothetical protein
MLKSPKLPKISRSLDPEYAIGIMSIADANALIYLGYLTPEGARCILPVSCWPLIRLQEPETKQSRSLCCLICLSNSINSEYIDNTLAN